MTPRRRRTPIVLLGIVAVFAAVEIGVRVLTDRDSAWNVRLGVAKRYDPVTYFRFKSNYPLGEGVVTNEAGFLAPPNLGHQEPADQRRVIYLGDSVSALPVPGFFPAQVEEIVEREGGIAVQTLNAAVPGYSSENARALLESELQHYDADYFVVYLGWNDLGQFGPEGLGFKRLQAGYQLNIFQRALTHLYSLRLFYALADVARHTTPSVDAPLSPEDEKRYAGYYPKHYEENLRAILALAKSRYPNVLVMNLATITNEHPTASELQRAHYPTGMDKNMRKLHRLVGTYNGVVAAVAAEQQVEIVDLFARFDSEAARNTFSDSCHVNREGAAMIARPVAEWVLRHEAQRAGGR